MRKITTTLALLIAFAMSTNLMAQHEEGQSNINLGIGFVTFGLNGESTLPPVSISYEYGINDKVSIGGYLGYTSSESDLIFYKATFSYLVVGARGSYHFEIIDNFDTYAGVMLGYNNASISYDPDLPAGIPEPEAGGITYGGFIGGRYHFTDNIGAFLELGYGVSAVNLGLAFKF